MPIFLVRGPGPRALLIRAQDRDHLNYLIDLEFDPGDCVAELYNGPIALEFEVPVSPGGVPEAERGPSRTDDDAANTAPMLFYGSDNAHEAALTPAVTWFGESGRQMIEALRGLAFPNFDRALNTQLDDVEDTEGDGIDTSALGPALQEDINETESEIQELERSARHALSPRESAILKSQDVHRVDPASIARGRELHDEWGAGTQWSDLGSDDFDPEYETVHQLNVAYLDGDGRAHKLTNAVFRDLSLGKRRHLAFRNKRVRFAAHFTLNDQLVSREYFVLPFDADGLIKTDEKLAFEHALVDQDTSNHASRFLRSGLQWSPSKEEVDILLSAANA